MGVSIVVGGPDKNVDGSDHMAEQEQLSGWIFYT
jgi:hypothetical protein